MNEQTNWELYTLDGTKLTDVTDVSRDQRIHAESGNTYELFHFRLPEFWIERGNYILIEPSGLKFKVQVMEDTMYLAVAGKLETLQQ